MSAITVRDAIITQFQNDATVSAEFGAEIKKGLTKRLNLTEVGKALRVAYLASSDVNSDVAGPRIRAAYVFLVSVGFYEPSDDDVDDRKIGYDSMIRNCIDSDATFNGTCLGITSMGKFQIAEDPDIEGVYHGFMPLICFKHETRGAR